MLEVKQGAQCFQKVERAYLVVGSTSISIKTHILLSILVMTFDPYILIHILSLMFKITIQLRIIRVDPHVLGRIILRTKLVPKRLIFPE